MTLLERIALVLWLASGLCGCASLRPVSRTRPMPAPHVAPGPTFSPLPVAP